MNKTMPLFKRLGLRAELEPLDGRKYYGSRIVLRDEKGDGSDAIEVWVMGDYTPSERELEACDSHFESALGYEICQLIVEAINGA